MNNKTANILVTGGAGYIGSHLINRLLLKGFTVYSIDNKISPEQKINNKCVFFKGSILSKDFLDSFFKKNKIDIVMHLAALIRVDESFKKPELYFKNNVLGGVYLLDAMRKAGVDKIAFASSAAVYGKLKGKLLTENDKSDPSSVYGQTKMDFEKILKIYGDNHGIKSISFRIFNASGADSSKKFKERHNPETHLIPNVLKALKLDKKIVIFGNSYKTADGTCFRDYIHVNDISEAFVLSIPKLMNSSLKTEIYNISSGKGYSVKEIIELCALALNKKVKILIKAKREGDSPSLVADNGKIKKDLKWKPKYNIKDIISDTINSFL